MEITLPQILMAREERALRQQELLGQYKCTLISFTMNIPGPVKYTPLIRRSFRWGCREIENAFPNLDHREYREALTGCEAIYLIREDPMAVKAVCTAMEEATPLGRLFDMDVLKPTGEKLDRETVRSCIVCGQSGKGCASRRIHPVSQLQETVNRIMSDHFLHLDGMTIREMAVGSLLEEVCVTPKPGLVDRNNSGSHRDMDLATFEVSANALGPYFEEAFTIGYTTADQTPEIAFQQLRNAGIRAESAMNHATGGVNTHKGAIFTLGILCGAAGRLYRPEAPQWNTDALLKEAAKLGQICLETDFRRLPETAGERLYHKLGLTGIRGQVASGLPVVRELALPVYENALNQGRSANDAGVLTLLHLIATLEDTNLYHRGGEAGAAWAKAAAANLLPEVDMEQILELDQAFIRRNLSPGGCADLLAATIFLHKIRRLA